MVHGVVLCRPAPQRAGSRRPGARTPLGTRGALGRLAQAASHSHASHGLQHTSRGSPAILSMAVSQDSTPPPAMTDKEKARLAVSNREAEAMLPRSRPVGEPLDPKADAERAVFSLKHDGCVHLGGILDAGTCESMLALVDRKIADADACRNSTAYLGGAPSRYDLKLPIDGPTRVAVRAAMRNGLAGVFEGVASDEAFLCELGVLASTPGANRQPVHPDTVCTGEEDERPIYTAFIALQDVTEDMGPTALIPGTNNVVDHQALCGAEHDSHWSLLESRDSVRAVLRSGDCVVFDSRTLHAGTLNNSDKRRSLLYICFQRPPVGERELPPAPTRRTPPSAYSILGELHNRYRLGGWNDWTEAWD
mmetsp:Transcript_40501/g.129090  ORF Transcript_40501/g.129090 Transcript_40501/m.129090 type:complete len:364 (+) Transcript_40501:71-1162(+)